VLSVAKRNCQGIRFGFGAQPKLENIWTYYITLKTLYSLSFIFFECLFSFTASSPEEKERFLSSVIRALQSDTALAGSLAGTHALVLRASARCEAGNYPAALEDAQQALAALQLQSQSQQRQVNVSWEGQAWRVSADAHQALGNVPAAVEALQEWAVHTPSFRTKALKEIQGLQSI
jgi:tetratricopeptide (TPR) repeat protein